MMDFTTISLLICYCILLALHTSLFVKTPHELWGSLTKLLSDWWRPASEGKSQREVLSRHIKTHFNLRRLSHARFTQVTLANLGFGTTFMLTMLLPVPSNDGTNRHMQSRISDRVGFMVGYACILLCCYFKSRLTLFLIDLVYSGLMAALTVACFLDSHLFDTLIDTLDSPAGEVLQCILRLYLGLWVLNLRLATFWNVMCSTAIACSAVRRSSSDISSFILREAFLLFLLLIHVRDAERKLQAEVRNSLESRIARSERKALTSLLNAVCDVVVPLTPELRLAEDAPKLGCLLLHGVGGRSLQGERLQRFMPLPDDRQRFESFVAARGEDAGHDGTDGVPATVLNVSMRDSLGGEVRVEVFHAEFQDLDDKTGHLIGIRERVEEGPVRQHRFPAFPDEGHSFGQGTAQDPAPGILGQVQSQADVQSSHSGPGPGAGPRQGVGQGRAGLVAGGSSDSESHPAKGKRGHDTIPDLCVHLLQSDEVAFEFDAVTFRILSYSSAFLALCGSCNSVLAFSDMLVAGRQFVVRLQDHMQDLLYQDGGDSSLASVVLRPPHSTFAGVEYTATCLLQLLPLEREDADLAARLTLTGIRMKPCRRLIQRRRRLSPTRGLALSGAAPAPSSPSGCLDANFLEAEDALGAFSASPSARSEASEAVSEEHLHTSTPLAPLGPLAPLAL